MAAPSIIANVTTVMPRPTASQTAPKTMVWSGFRTGQPARLLEVVEGRSGAFDADDHEAARTLYCIGLYATARADDPGLRAHIVADLAAQYNFLGFPADCLEVARFGGADERVGPAVRMVLAAVKARAYALLGNGNACRQQIELAERHQAAVEPADGWLDTIATPAQLHAGSGHALVTLARRTAGADVHKLAVEQLSIAIDQLDPAGQTRARALCMAQLAALRFEAGVLDEGVHWAGRLLDATAGVRSARLAEYLNQLWIAVAVHKDETTVRNWSMSSKNRDERLRGVGDEVESRYGTRALPSLAAGEPVRSAHVG